MSGGMNNETTEQESLSSGEPFFMTNPIQPTEPNPIWKDASNRKIMTDESDKLRKTKSANDLPNLPDGDDLHDGISEQSSAKKPKLKWTRDLENHFMQAIQHIGFDKAVPTSILNYMSVEGLTRAQVASHLQKYRMHLKNVDECEAIAVASTQMSSRRAVNSNFALFVDIKPPASYNYNLSMDNLFKSQLGHIGPSSLIVNNNIGLHGSSHNMNPPPIFDLSQSGTTLLPMRGSLGFSDDVLSLNEEKRSVFGTSQAPQVPRFGQYGTPSNVGLPGSSHNMNPTPTNDLSQSGSKLLPMRGSFGFSNDVSPINEDSRSVFRTSQALQAPRFGQYGTLSNVGLHDSSHNMNPTPTNHLSQSGYNLLPMRGSFGFSDDVLPIKEKSIGVFGTPQGSQAPSFGQYGTPNNVGLHSSSHNMNLTPTNDLSQIGSNLLPMRGNLRFSDGVLPINEERRSVLGTCQTPQTHGFGQYDTRSNILGTNANVRSKYVGIILTKNGDLIGPEGVRVNGNDNDFPGDWNANNNNMSNQGSSTSMFSSTLSPLLDNVNQVQSNLTAQTNDVVPVIENPSMFDYHHGNNEDFFDTVNSHIDQNQPQGEVIGENLDMSTDERKEIFAHFPLEDITNWNDLVDDEDFMNYVFDQDKPKYSSSKF